MFLRNAVSGSQIGQSTTSAGRRQPGLASNLTWTSATDDMCCPTLRRTLDLYMVRALGAAGISVQARATSLGTQKIYQKVGQSNARIYSTGQLGNDDHDSP